MSLDLGQKLGGTMHNYCVQPTAGADVLDCRMAASARRS
jgi:hypothetical protein